MHAYIEDQNWPNHWTVITLINDSAVVVIANSPDQAIERASLFIKGSE